MKNSVRYLLLLTLSIFLFVSCMDDMDDVLPENRDLVQANEFVYRALNYFYLYKAESPELANDYFSTNREKTDFLSDFKTPEDLFKHLKYQGDKFSVLVDDYVELERVLQGKNYSTGASFVGFTFENQFYILVQNSIKNSSAAQNNVVRGDVFHAINGQSITQSNVNDLLNAPSLELSYAYEENGRFNKSEDTVILQNEELEEPAIGMYKVLEIGNTKVGYLLYNSFLVKYNQDLNRVFGYFKSEGIDALVLDLRYNSGGSIYSAEVLSSMITGQFTGEVLYESEWNADLQPYYGETVPFTDKLDSGEAIESLRLSKVAVLTQSRTASASELVINALNPYIDILQVGTPTRGKYQGSVLVYDSPNFSQKHRNPMHRYAMLPLVLKIKNAEGFTDFDEGLPADIFVEEKVSDIKNNLGTAEELLLRTALETMGINLPTARSEMEREETTITPIQITSDKWENILYKTME